MTKPNDNIQIQTDVFVECIVLGYSDGRLHLLVEDHGENAPSLYRDTVYGHECLDEAANRMVRQLVEFKRPYCRQVRAFVQPIEGKRVATIVYCILVNIDHVMPRALERHGLQWIETSRLQSLDQEARDRVGLSVRMLRQLIHTEPICFSLLPDLFTLTQYQHVYEALRGQATDKRNFRKRVKQLPYVEKTELIDKLTSKRGASLYRFNKRTFHDEMP